ncbi:MULTISPECIES: hypothetical protein [unclassified Ornithinimicrobium]|uniref:hypothetical protein n=1 Tax=unclassified Ornithinimicrobium TaxID=2615080 RepID=UPI003854338C
MNRTTRTTATLAALALLPALASAAQAAPPRMYHTVSHELAYLEAVQVDECQETHLWVSAAQGHYAGLHGPSNKQQGPSGVLVQVIDTCAELPDGPGTAAAEPGGDIVLEVQAQAMIGVSMDQQLTWARFVGTLEGTDQDGNPVSVHVDAAWSGVGPLEHTTGHANVRLDGGNVNSANNDWRRDATGVATVALDGQTLPGFSGDGVLERTKSHCIEIPKGKPSDEEFNPCFGFPG